jgi:hypothetical protein
MKSNERRYFWLMGTCITLVALAWFVVRLWSVVAAIVMSCIAAVIPPAAVIIANRPWVTRYEKDEDENDR